MKRELRKKDIIFLKFASHRNNINNNNSNNNNNDINNNDNNNT